MARVNAREYRGYGEFPAYVPVAERRAEATAKSSALTRRGETLEPVHLTGSAIAKTFWGKAWCRNLERYGDYSNRLPRGRSYVRSGAVIDLKITGGAVKARVSGSELYDVDIAIATIAPARFRALVGECAGKIDSVIDLLRGKLPTAVMEIVSTPKRGLFPEPRQIELSCSCPDAASMCKHVAAVLYGVGARLDERPELLFLLRGADHQALIAAGVAGVAGARTGSRAGKSSKLLEASSLSDVFGIDLEPASGAPAVPKPKRGRPLGSAADRAPPRPVPRSSRRSKA